MNALSDYLRDAFEGEIHPRCLRLFENVAEEQTRRFVNRCRIVELGPGDTLFTAFDDQRYLYILLMGNVKSFVVTPGGREQITHLFFPGDVFGGLMFGPNQNPKPWAKAVEDVRLISLDEAEFMELMRTAPRLCLNIFDYNGHAPSPGSAAAPNHDPYTSRPQARADAPPSGRSPG